MTGFRRARLQQDRVLRKWGRADGKATQKALAQAMGLPWTVGGAVSRMRPPALVGMAVPFLRQGSRKRNSWVGRVGELWNFREGWGTPVWWCHCRSGNRVVHVGGTPMRGHENERSWDLGIAPLRACAE